MAVLGGEGEDLITDLGRTVGVSQPTPLFLQKTCSRSPSHQMAEPGVAPQSADIRSGAFPMTWYRVQVSLWNPSRLSSPYSQAEFGINLWMCSLRRRSIY